MTPGMHLAELNLGRLLAPTDGPRVAEFMGARDRVNGLGRRMPGFGWMYLKDTGLFWQHQCNRIAAE